MTNRSLQQLFKLSAVAAAAVLALSVRADLRGQAQNDRHGNDQASADRNDHGHGDDDRDGGERDNDGGDRDEHERRLPLPTGQFVTPLAIRGAVQQFLNPGLPAYADFVVAAKPCDRS